MHALEIVNRVSYNTTDGFIRERCYLFEKQETFIASSHKRIRLKEKSRYFQGQICIYHNLYSSYKGTSQREHL